MENKTKPILYKTSMLPFKLMYKAVPYLLKLLKYLEKHKKSFIYSMVYTKIINVVISILIKARVLGYYSIIKGVYYFLSVLNIILIAFVLGFFSDLNFNLDLPFLAVIWSGLLALIPSFLLEYLTDLFIKCASNVKVTIKRFVTWVYGDDGYKPKVKKWRKDISDPFSNIHNASVGGVEPNQSRVTPVDMEVPSDSGGGLGNSDGVPKYVVVIVLTVITIGFTYYMFPDLYYTGYTYIKGKLFPGKPGSGDRGPDGNLIVHYKPYKGKGVSGVEPFKPMISSSNSTNPSGDLVVASGSVLPSDVSDGLVVSGEVSGVVTTPSNPVETLSKPMFGPEIPPTLSSITASSSMDPSEITLRKRIATILCSDKSETAKFSKVDNLVQIINHGADSTTISENNAVVADVLSEYAKTQLTPKPANVMLDVVTRTPSFANTSWTTPTPATTIEPPIVPPFNPKTAGFK